MKLPALSNIGNFFPKLKPHVEKKSDRPFRAAQIEVTSRCSTGCLFCPHDALSSQWMDGDMPVAFYQEHIVPHLDLFELVYLQGWGEPMLHPHLWNMLEMAQQKGCRTGFTTNGTWLQAEQNEKLCDMGVDLISVSFAGTAASVHESLRTHSDFSRLCTNFESLADLKERRGCTAPWLELHFLMTRLNLSELPASWSWRVRWARMKSWRPILPTRPALHWIKSMSLAIRPRRSTSHSLNAHKQRPDA